MVLWKKESRSANACYIDLLPWNQSHSLKFELIKLMYGSIEKNENDANEHRKRGNESFNEKNWYDAIEHYNKSIRFAPIGSECLGYGYANRSACFLHLKMYDKCLADIELATSANYPQHLMAKLNERRATCLKAMKESVAMDGKVTQPQLSYTPNKAFPGLADILEVRKNGEYGRHVVATRDVEVGKIVLMEDVFAIQVDYSCQTVCKTCAKHMVNLIPCPNCTSVMFCRTECMEVNDLHKKFCGALYHHLTRDILIVETILTAVLAFPDADSLMKFVECALQSRDLDAPECESNAQIKYRLFLKLFALPKDISEVGQEIVDMYMSLLEIPAIVQFFRSVNERRFLMHLIWQHYCISEANTFGIPDLLSMGTEYLSMIGLYSSLFSRKQNDWIRTTAGKKR